MINQIIGDLTHLGVAYIIFLLAYSSNIILSLYNNIALYQEAFDKTKIKQSIVKGIVLLVGSAMLVISINAAALFLNNYGLFDGVQEVATVATIIATIGASAVKYIIEAYKTFSNILSF